MTLMTKFCEGQKKQMKFGSFRIFVYSLQSTNRRFVHNNVTTQRRVNMNEVNFDILVNRTEETQHVLQNNARLVITVMSQQKRGL